MSLTSTPDSVVAPGGALNGAAESFTEELQVRAAEASTQVQAAELLGEELQASIACSDLADLHSLASRNDVVLDLVVLEPEDA